MKQEFERFLLKAVSRLPGEHLGRRVSRTKLELSTYYIPRDLENLLGIADPQTEVRVRFFPRIVDPWDTFEPGKWTNVSLYDAVETLCGDDDPEYIDGTDSRYSSGKRILHLKAGSLVGPIRIKESRRPYCSIDILVEDKPQLKK